MSVIRICSLAALISSICPAFALAQAEILALAPDPLVMDTSSVAELQVTIAHDPIDPHSAVEVLITVQGELYAPAAVTVPGSTNFAPITVTSGAAAGEATVTATVGATSISITVDVQENPVMWYRDADGDGFGSPYDTVFADLPPFGYVENDSDCDDRFAAVRPGADEICDGIDNDCDGTVDQYWPDAGQSCFAGAGECKRAGILVCGPDAESLECSALPGVPGTEICDCLDNDCDGVIDNDCPSAAGDPVPLRGSLEVNSPNPFNPLTKIRFYLPRAETVHLRVLDLSGRVVKTLVDGRNYPAGRHSVSWNGMDEKSRRVASGVFFYTIEAGDYVETKRMTLLK